MVVNYASSAGPAEDVASQIKALGGDAIVVGANSSKKEDVDRRAQFLEPNKVLLMCAPRWHVTMRPSLQTRPSWHLMGWHVKACA